MGRAGPCAAGIEFAQSGWVKMAEEDRKEPSAGREMVIGRWPEPEQVVRVSERASTVVLGWASGGRNRLPVIAPSATGLGWKTSRGREEEWWGLGAAEGSASWGISSGGTGHQICAGSWGVGA